MLTASTLEVPTAYEEQSLELRAFLPPVAIAVVHAKQASHNYLVFNLAELVEAVF